MNLEQSICRTKYRAAYYAKSRVGYPIRDPRGMTGRLVDRALQVLEQQGRRPTNKEIAKRFPPQSNSAKGDKSTSAEASVGKFLNGDPKGNTPWHERGREILRWLIETDEPTPEAKAAADRIDNYFFREPDSADPTPKFFRGRRQGSPDPWSVTEMAGELQWFRRQIAFAAPAEEGDAPRTSRLVICLDDSAFEPPVPQGRELGGAVIDAVADGGEVVFVYMGGTDGALWYEGWVERARAVALAAIARGAPFAGRVGGIAVDRRSAGPERDYLTPHFQFAWFEAWDGTKAERSLFTMRARFYESSGSMTGSQPFATLCNSAECEHLGGWFDSLKAQPQWVVLRPPLGGAGRGSSDGPSASPPGSAGPDAGAPHGPESAGDAPGKAKKIS